MTLWATSTRVTLTGLRVLVLVALALVTLGPVVRSVTGAVRGEPRTRILPEWTVAGNTVLFAGITTAACTLGGVFCALVAGRTTFWLRTSVLAVLTLPALLPPHVIALSLRSAMTVRAPWVWTPLARCEHPLSAAVVVATLCYMPLVMWVVYVGLRFVPRVEEEHAALHLGWPRLLLRIVLPRIAREVGAGAALVFLLCLQSFEICSVVGLRTLITEVFSQAASLRATDEVMAASVVLVVGGGMAAIGLVALMDSIVWRTESWPASAPRRLVLPPGIQIVLAILFSVMFAGAALPLWNLCVCSGGLEIIWTMWAKGAPDLLNSARYALGATALVLGGVAVIAPLLIHRVAVVRWVTALVALGGFATPGIVLSLCLLDWLDGAAPTSVATALEGTPRMVLILALRYFFVAALVVACCWASDRGRSAELAAIYNLTCWARWRRVHWPRIRFHVGAAMAGVFILCLRELELAILHAPPGATTLSARIFNLLHFGPPGWTAATCLLLALATATALLPVWAMYDPRPSVRGRQGHGCAEGS